jgi:hypothetical protein
VIDVVQLASQPTLLMGLYEIIKWWGPILGFVAMVFKLRKDVISRADTWMNSLLNNHLSHIQEATMTTVVETQKTNELLTAAALKTVMVAEKVEDVRDTLTAHHEKETQVWAGVLNTLSVLEDRTRVELKTPRARRRR